MWRAPKRGRQRGIAATEFAIALPLLLLLMLATAEIGRLLSQYDTLTKAVRDGSRYLASNVLVGTQQIVQITPQIQTNTQNLVVTGNVLGAGSPILPGLATGNVTVADAGNGYVSVSATYTYQPILASFPTFGLTAGPVSLAIPMTATVVMRGL
jgi:Flp pilus assembly protein TadG